MYCGQKVRPIAKVTIDSLYIHLYFANRQHKQTRKKNQQEVVYEKSISTKTNDLDLRLEVV